MPLNIIKEERLSYESAGEVLQSNYKTWNLSKFVRDIRALTEICSKRYY